MHTFANVQQNRVNGCMVVCIHVHVNVHMYGVHRAYACMAVVVPSTVMQACDMHACLRACASIRQTESPGKAHACTHLCVCACVCAWVRVCA